MPLLESVVRETLRLCPPSVLTGQRVVMHGTKFDESLAMPGMSHLASPTLEIHLDENNYPNPNAFDPYRFMSKHADGVSIQDMSASKIDEKYLPFGYGKQACPGRFITVRQAKLILAKLFHDFNFDWVGKPPEKLSRQCVEGQIFPDMSTRIVLTRREKI
ncbi:hypothetical protein MMC18_009594 [Xylographa bjoerkii]|nr:hypothetical protein [Xylographa bjoerkii]